MELKWSFKPTSKRSVIKFRHPASEWSGNWHERGGAWFIFVVCTFERYRQLHRYFIVLLQKESWIPHALSIRPRRWSSRGWFVGGFACLLRALDYSCALQREILVHGRLFVSLHHICFNSNIFGWVTNVSEKTAQSVDWCQLVSIMIVFDSFTISLDKSDFVSWMLLFAYLIFSCQAFATVCDMCRNSIWLNGLYKTNILVSTTCAFYLFNFCVVGDFLSRYSGDWQKNDCFCYPKCYPAHHADCQSLFLLQNGRLTNLTCFCRPPPQYTFASFLSREIAYSIMNRLWRMDLENNLRQYNDDRVSTEHLPDHLVISTRFDPAISPPESSEVSDDSESSNRRPTSASSEHADNYTKLQSPHLSTSRTCNSAIYSRRLSSTIEATSIDRLPLRSTSTSLPRSSATHYIPVDVLKVKTVHQRDLLMESLSSTSLEPDAAFSANSKNQSSPTHLTNYPSPSPDLVHLKNKQSTNHIQRGRRRAVTGVASPIDVSEVDKGGGAAPTQHRYHLRHHLFRFPAHSSTLEHARLAQTLIQSIDDCFDDASSHSVHTSMAASSALIQEYCNCLDHGKITMMDRIFPAAVDVVKRELFGDEAMQQNGFMREFLTLRSYTAIKASEWTDLGRGFQERQLTYNVPLRIPLGN